MRKIIITEPFCDAHIEKIRSIVKEPYKVEQYSGDITNEIWKTILQSAEIIIGQPPIEFLQKPKVDCPKLKFIQMTWAGTDVYTRSKLPFPKDKVILANGSGSYGMIMSQFVVGMILSMMLNFKQYYENQHEHIWEKKGIVQSLDHAKVLIYGAGDIGTAVAKRLQGFEAHTIGVCRDTTKPRKYFDKLSTLEEAEKYLPEVDVVVGCIPNSDETMNYLNVRRLGMMKNTAILVNVGRGNFIDCMSLDHQLRSGKIFGAALDVTNPEPLPVEHPLWDNPRCMITPHTSGATFGQLAATEDLVCNIVCKNIQRYCFGEDIINRIF